MVSNATSYHSIIEEAADPRTADWPFVFGLPGVSALTISYVVAVTYAGPKLMAPMNPFKLNNILIVYNLAQVLLCCWLLFDAADIFRQYSWQCQAIDHSLSPLGLQAARLTYKYYVVKILDLLDTIFFVLRKKQNQVTFLHVYHHTLLIFVSWTIVKYAPGGNWVFVCLINSFVHIVMYFYYFLAALLPRQQFWWKKYITRLQLVQFVLCLVHGLQMFKYDCGFPKWSSAIILFNSSFFFVLFGNFYLKTYLQKRHKA